jgi:hypothetical protein
MTRTRRLWTRLPDEQDDEEVDSLQRSSCARYSTTEIAMKIVST